MAAGRLLSVAVGSGVAVAADRATGHTELSARAATLAVVIPVALYMVSVWAVLGRHKPRTHVGPLTAPRAAVAVLVLGAVTASVLVVGLATAAVVAAFVIAETADESPS